jgi:DNA-binding MarR family transcriptional regulator
MDLVGWQRISAWAEESDLAFTDLRLLLALALKIEDGPSTVSELADIAGFSLDTAYPTIHAMRRRGYVSEEQRRYSLTAKGRELAGMLDDAHREGIRAYVGQLDDEEHRQLTKAFAS